MVENSISLAFLLRSEVLTLCLSLKFRQQGGSILDFGPTVGQFSLFFPESDRRVEPIAAFRLRVWPPSLKSRI